jgi:DNA-binding transcriptional ArsR family regulator
MAEWTFITKHAVALSYIARHPRITALELGAEMGITERAVRKLIADLYAAGYITKKKEGRGIRYRINSDQPMRHEAHREFVVGDLLQSLGWKKQGQKSSE